MAKAHPLPKEVLKDVGFFFVTWSQVDYGLERVIWAASGLRPAIGKIHTEQLAGGTKAQRAQALLKIRSPQIASDTEPLFKRLADIIAMRNRLSHGLIFWFPEAKAIGTFSRKNVDHNDIFEAMRTDLTDLHQAITGMLDIFEALMKLADGLEQPEEPIPQSPNP